jgi:hypothetical protein
VPGARRRYLAVGRGDSIIALLAERGAKLDSKDESGRTPLDVALGVPGKGRGWRAGEPGPVHESTAALLRQLMNAGTEGAATARE